MRRYQQWLVSIPWGRFCQGRIEILTWAWSGPLFGMIWPQPLSSLCCRWPSPLSRGDPTVPQLPSWGSDCPSGPPPCKGPSPSSSCTELGTKSVQVSFLLRTNSFTLAEGQNQLHYWRGPGQNEDAGILVQKVLRGVPG